jgi:hypothetical protein
MLSDHAYLPEYGSHLYEINDALGRAAFAAGDYEAAIDYLQKAADSAGTAPPAVSLDYFGPNFWLAEQLLHVGKGKEVLQFLQTVKQKLWIHDTEHLDGWISDLKAQPNALVSYEYLEN